MYLFFGVLTTLINYGVFTLWLRLFGEHTSVVANIPAFVLATAFAFVTNKKYVFCSRDWSRGTLLRELSSFVSARLLSWGFEELGLFAGTVFFQADERFVLGFNCIYLLKIALSFVAVLVNYAVSKFLVFKTKNQKA